MDVDKPVEADDRAAIGQCGYRYSKTSLGKKNDRYTVMAQLRIGELHAVVTQRAASDVDGDDLAVSATGFGEAFVCGKQW